ncbi:MAG: DUF4012 domain-containing protein [bacterium]|nr:DUF4012 domain-containing protein [bacterium]
MTISLKKLTISLGVIVGLVLSLVGWTTWSTYQAITALKAGQWQKSSQAAGRALPFISLANTLSANAISDLVITQSTLSMLRALPEVQEGVMTALSEQELQPSTKTLIQQTTNSLQTILNELPNSIIIRRALSPGQLSQLPDPSTVKKLTEYFVQSDHTYIVLLQNTQELRATGGFAGSFAIVTVKHGLPIKVELQDIYQPDGQFTGFIPAPSGVTEYLSSGRGLRLPDANWSPDFPTSAEMILAYFAAGTYQSVDGVVALNLGVVEKVLGITDDIFLPDYDIYVTPQNLAQLARADRDSFFPGSYQKTQFLSHLFKQLRIQLTQLSVAQYRQIATVLSEAVYTQDIQVYSSDPEMQSVLTQYGLAGALDTQAQLYPEALYLGLIESNVGINKANKNISRSVSLELERTTTKVSIRYDNRNPVTPPADLTSPASSQSGALHLHYLNYQRILLKPGDTVTGITMNGKPIATWHEADISTASGENLRQVGFLVSVYEQSTSTVEIQVSHSPLSPTPIVVIDHQAGVPATKYSLLHRLENKQMVIDRDTVLEL